MCHGMVTISPFIVNLIYIIPLIYLYVRKKRSRGFFGIMRSVVHVGYEHMCMVESQKLYMHCAHKLKSQSDKKIF